MSKSNSFFQDKLKTNKNSAVFIDYLYYFSLFYLSSTHTKQHHKILPIFFDKGHIA